MIEQRSGRPTEIDGEAEAKLVMLACSEPAERVGVIGLCNCWQIGWWYKDTPSTFGYVGVEIAKKNKLRPWAIKSWCIPKVSTRFIAKMEDVLAVYQRPYDEKYPMVCMDEKGKELQSQRVDLGR